MFHLKFSGDPLTLLEQHGHVPLPPYITHADEEDDVRRYQTVFASAPGAVAAPSTPIPVFSSELPVGTLESLERQAILAAMGRHGGNAAAVARELDIGRATLYRKLKQYNVPGGAPQ